MLKDCYISVNSIAVDLDSVISVFLSLGNLSDERYNVLVGYKLALAFGDKTDKE